jgi:hypothetical protein
MNPQIKEQDLFHFIMNPQIKEQDLFHFILTDEYWMQEAVEHFLATIDRRRYSLEESFLETQASND